MGLAASRRRGAITVSTLVETRSSASRSSLERKVLSYVRQEGLLARGDSVLAAVSGGPDSVALLSVLAALAPRLDLRLHVVHFNYGLRGRESDEDAEFVEDLCACLGIGLTSERLPVKGSSPIRHGRSLQERARLVRYERLAALARHVGATRVALGHTADDHAETLCMWMVRGTGLGGLRGIPPSREGLFVRPLLAFGRAQILSYLASRGLTFRTDSGNAKEIYFRNRIRRDVLPILKRENPSLLTTWQRQAELLREDDRYLDEMARKAFDRLCVEHRAGQLRLCRSGLTALPVALQRRVVRLAVREIRGDVHGASFHVVESILRVARKPSTGRRVVCRGLTVVGQETDLYFWEKSLGEGHGEVGQVRRAARCMIIPISAPSTVWWRAGARSFQVHLELGEESSKGTMGGRDRNHVRLDADRFSTDLVLRSWQPGDRFYPVGMGGHQQKLQDFFTNLKIPRLTRGSIPLLVAPEGILWVAGYRADHRFVAGASTRRVLHAYLSGELTDHQG